MVTVLLASASVHTTAAACDLLAGWLEADDRLVHLGVVEAGVTKRDLADAANVARGRLVAPAVEALVRTGDPPTVVAAVADRRDVDHVVLGGARGDPSAAGSRPGSTVRALLAADRWPVTVLPAAPSP